MPDERAFTRRQEGVNPIALELERLAEQRALRTLGTRPPPPSSIPPEAPEPRNALGQTQGEERDADVAYQIWLDQVAGEAARREWMLRR